MTITDSTASTSEASSPQLPLLIPSGLVHVYFVQPAKVDKKGIERTTIYYTIENATSKMPQGSKVKFMAKDPAIREDLVALGRRPDLADVNEEFTWAKGGALSIRVVRRA